MIYIMDASALMAMVKNEKGGSLVDTLVDEHECMVSSVNIAEVSSKLLEAGVESTHLKRMIRTMNVQIIDFNQEQALASAELRLLTKSAGLSLGDRACLSLAKLMDGTAVTADRPWMDVAEAVGVKVLLIR